MVIASAIDYIKELLRRVDGPDSRFEFDAHVMEAAANLVPGYCKCRDQASKAASGLVDALGKHFLMSVATKEVRDELGCHDPIDTATQVIATGTLKHKVMVHFIKYKWSADPGSPFQTLDESLRDPKSVCEHLNKCLEDDVLREFFADVLRLPVTTVVVESHFSMYNRAKSTTQPNISDDTVEDQMLLKEQVLRTMAQLGLEEATAEVWLSLMPMIAQNASQRGRG